MSNIVMLFGCLVAGILLRINRRLPDNAHVTINGFIVHVALPALILSRFHGIQLTPDLIWPVLMPWLLFAMSAGIFIGVAKLFRFPAVTTGALIITAGLGNTSFVGLPMIETFYGTGQLATGILIDQLGTYLVLSTAGIAVACFFSSTRPSFWGGSSRILKFPPLIGLALALISNSVEYPVWLSDLLRRLGDTLAPLALVSVGLQLRLEELKGRYVPLMMGLGFKLVLGPLLVMLLFVSALSQGGETTQVTIFEAAMGPQIGGAIVAQQYGLNSPLITLMVGGGITLSFFTLPIWHWALHAIV